ncbi:MAG: ATP synthase F1 subunit delta [Actinomycetota bacterium]
MTTPDQIAGYADALLSVARAEGSTEIVGAQLREVARAVEGNDELRSSLSNNLLPAATRNQIVDDLLAGKASDTVRALVGLVVSAGRGGQLGDIVGAFTEKAASSSGRRVAVVRSAVALTDDQKTRLAQALATTAGGPVELENVIDPDVIGGAVTTIGDTVIDGSLRTKINQLHDAL